MPKYRSKPRVIEAVRFDPAELSLIPAKVYMTMAGDWVVYNGLHSSEIKLKPGDYIRTDDPHDNYPIDADYMAANYDELIEVYDHQ